MAAGNGHVYSSSYDGGIRVWTPQGHKVAVLPSTGSDVGVIKLHGNNVYAGDENGNVVIYENSAIKAIYNVLEEVKDIVVSLPYMFTARDLYVTVTEINPEESKSGFVTRHTMEGRCPLRLAGNHLVIVARGGNSLQLHDASVNTEFKKLHQVKVSDMIVTCVVVSGEYVWTGGWDGLIRRWRIFNDQLEEAGTIEIGTCINALTASPDSLYAAVSGGRVIRILNV